MDNIAGTKEQRHGATGERVHQFSVSADGFGAGDALSLERPFGTIDGDALHGWMFDTASWRGPGGRYGLDDYIVRDFSNNIGAEIMGRNKYSPYRGPHNHAECKAGGATNRHSTPRCSC